VLVNVVAPCITETDSRKVILERPGYKEWATEQMLPIAIDMRDHLRQEKTGNLPSPLPEIAKQRDFAAGTLGLWGPDHFVIYYVSGRVPQPGIVILGKVTGDVSIFDRPGSVTVRLEREIDGGLTVP
jgi:hypothetical protein